MKINKDIVANLPALEIAETVNSKLAGSDAVVVTAPPGAGKSTLLPLTISEKFGKVLVLEPRRLAARQIAERMAEIAGERVGESVGYRVRFDTKVSDKTKIEVLTEGILTRMLADDPTLEGVSVVVFDEFHERSLNSDVAFALTRACQQILRPDLKVVVMSATIDTSELCTVLACPLVECNGRLYDVEVKYVETEINTSLQSVNDIANDVAKTIRTAITENDGDVLAFLPGQAEIVQCQKILEDSVSGIGIYPLYGLQNQQEQRKAIMPARNGERRIVLATPIAETSLTIEGIKIVVDSGLCRTLVFDPRNALSRLTTVRITKDMAEQRTGRAGRMAEGVCYRLWTKATELKMAEHRTPEIVDSDLSSMVLDITKFGESDVYNLPWLTPPPKAHVEQARKLLLALEAIDENGKISNIGKKIADIPCHPRLAKMLVEAESPDKKALATDIAAIMDEKDPISSVENDCDINTRIALLRDKRRTSKAGKMQGQWGRIMQIATQYRKMVHVDEDNHAADYYKTGKLIATAYPERIAANCGHNTFKLANGESVRVDENDDISACEYLAIASLGKKIHLASPLSKDDVLKHAKTKRNVSWDNKLGKIVAQEEKRVGNILLESKPINDDIRGEIIDTICSASTKYGLTMFDFSEKVQLLQRRIDAVRNWHEEAELPDLSTENVLQRASEWLPMYIENATTVGELNKINMCEAVWSLLTYEQQQMVDRLAPTHIQVPTGSKIKVDYRVGAEAPVISVRLQECFGMLDTPKVDNGRLPVLMELLSPGFKPVQLTRDLKSFWKNAYFEVRKELKRRYPKHPWPDNPETELPTRGVKKAR